MKKTSQALALGTLVTLLASCHHLASSFTVCPRGRIGTTSVKLNQNRGQAKRELLVLHQRTNPSDGDELPNVDDGATSCDDDVVIYELDDDGEEEDDESSSLSIDLNEMEELESRLIASKFSLGGPGGSGYGTAPTKGQCAFYKWSQDEDSIVMEIPLPRRAMKRDIKLAAGPKTFQLAVKSSPELGVLAGEWYGEIDPTRSVRKNHKHRSTLHFPMLL